MESREYFEDVATRWDDMRTAFFSDAVRKKAADRAKVRPGTTAADLGAGTGFLTEELIGRKVNVIAIDQSPTMLIELHKKFGSTGLVEYRVGDAAAIPIESGAVDYVFANMYLHHVEDPPAAIREIARILKPGGAVVITDLDTHSHEFLRTEQHDRWLGFERAEVLRWFREAGLINGAIDCLNENCCTTSHSTCCDGTEPESARISIFIAYAESRPKP